jgi:hypothetical protein
VTGEPTPRSRGLRRVATLSAICLLAASSARAQTLSGVTDVNVSKRAGDETECTISRDPNNPQRLFAACACSMSAAGLFAARSSNGGVDWAYPLNPNKTIAYGERGEWGKIPASCCDPSSAWDSFGNLFLTYLDYWRSAIVLLRSTDGGATFSPLAQYEGNVDQPTVAVARPGAGASGAVWIVWNQGEKQEDGDRIDYMMAVGAPVTAQGVGPFGGVQKISDMKHCSFGDVAIGPGGAVALTCQAPTGDQGPTKILVTTDPDGLGTQHNFSTAVKATDTNVGGLDRIPAQYRRAVDAEAGLAFDTKLGSQRYGRLYLVYTEKTANKDDMHVMLRYKDNGGSWSQPIRVSDDAGGKSQFLPRIAVDPSSGSISVCWYDCRNSAENTAMQVRCTIASPTEPEPKFAASVAISDVSSSAKGVDYEYGDYSGLAYADGVLYPIWVDTATSASQSPKDTTFEAMTDQVREKDTVQVGATGKAPVKRTPKPRKPHRRTHPKGAGH